MFKLSKYFLLQLAENLDGQLARMGDDLKEIISHLNSSSKTQDTKDPVYQIGKVDLYSFPATFSDVIVSDLERAHG